MVSRSRPTLVLVHGAWHGAWCWDFVTPLLADAGLQVVSVDLPGRGENMESLADLHGDAQAVTAVLEAIAGPVVLVGHSYGGAVITEAGVHDRVAHLVYVAAFALEPGEAVANAAADEARAVKLDHTGRPRLADALITDDDGETTTVRAEMAVPLFYNDCPPDVAAWAVPRLGRHRMGNFGQPVEACAWRAHPSTFVACSIDNAIHPDLQRIMAKRTTHSVEIATDHSPFLGRPQSIADLLIAVATA
ncbi:MAG TPA: alpha/beta fold hydrolase [Ilumatobacteraceae bacterium]|jgi:pimeloyl-ACP methyl ester carboxylesterase